jgi:membrane protease YdiL (CAAX protease family)
VERHDRAADLRHPRRADTDAHVPPDLSESPPPIGADPGGGGAPASSGPERGTLAAGPALGLAAAAMVGGIVLAAILGGIALLVTGDSDGPLLLAAGFVGLWVPLVGATVVASTAFGTGSLRRDVGLAFEPADLWRGLLVGIVGIVAASAVQLALSPFDRLTGTNTNYIDDQTGTAVGAIVVALSTMVGAPFVEELFFRGLVQRGLARLGILAAVLQAVIFGIIHVTPEEGLGNVGIILGVGTFGLVLGLAARRFGRLGPTMVGHAVFNAAAVVPMLLR